MNKRLVLVGGGHTHALLLRRLVRDPIAGIKITLVSTAEHTPYSGMFPGHLAGYFRLDEIGINVAQLAARAGAHFIATEVLSIDRHNRVIQLRDHEPIVFDILSINVGSEPNRTAYGFGIKPMASFLQQLPEILQKTSLAVVGGGAGGIEVALSLQKRLGKHCRIALIHRGEKLLPGAPVPVQRFFEALCRTRGIALHLNVSDGDAIAQAFESVIWVTTSRGPSLLVQSGFFVDEDQFLKTDDRLLVVGEDSIFAVGDCARIEKQSRPRSGVYAVRLANPLYENLRALVQSRPLSAVRLQTNHLAIITTGERYAVAIWGRFYLKGSWVWSWKRWIDRRFMRKFLFDL